MVVLDQRACHLVFIPLSPNVVGEAARYLGHRPAHVFHAPYAPEFSNAIYCNIALSCHNEILIESEESMFQQIIWNDEPGGNIEHIEEHGLTIVDVEHVLASFE